MLRAVSQVHKGLLSTPFTLGIVILEFKGREMVESTLRGKKTTRHSFLEYLLSGDFLTSSKKQFLSLINSQVCPLSFQGKLDTYYSVCPEQQL